MMSFACDTKKRSCCLEKNMARYLLLMCVFGLQVSSSVEMPPRLRICRVEYKAKPPANADPNWTEEYIFDDGVACTRSVTLELQNVDSIVTNITDPRNCANFYKCQGLSCQQCPCDDGETFNPITLRCDNTGAACECESSAPALSTTIITDIAISEISTKRTNNVIRPSQTEKFIPGVVAPGSTQNEETPSDSTNGVVIIVVIVVLTVVILLALIIGFVLWHKGLFPLRKKTNMHPSNNDGYLHTLPPQERHVYAEIDERTINHEMQSRRMDEETQRQLQHIYAPPISGNTSMTTNVHPHETFILPSTQLRLYPQFSGYPVSSQTPAVNKDLIRFSAASPENKGNFSQNNNQAVTMMTGCCGECAITDNSSETSCSGCSHCSALSNPTPLESQESVDRRTLLNYSHTTPPFTQFNFVSKQVYI